MNPNDITKLIAQLNDHCPQHANKLEHIGNLIKTGQSADVDMAIAGLKQLGDAILNSGIPQAVLTFGITYKLLDSMAKAPQQAIEEYSISNY